uniref:Uncharacterized protein n=1 Tax=Nelumbo nucifera TaxID=4432 RepID=A0A822ZM99_NELNU|nr:TPA_asm: hypothetical protein HUJ06_002881 [Nelumbo nucifera]
MKKKKQSEEGKGEIVVGYVDTLLNLQLPDGGRMLTGKEIVSLCGSFSTAALI